MKAYGEHPRELIVRPLRKILATGVECVHRIDTDATDEQVHEFLQWECRGVKHALALEGAEVEAIPDIPGQEEKA